MTTPSTADLITEDTFYECNQLIERLAPIAERLDEISQGFCEEGDFVPEREVVRKRLTRIARDLISLGRQTSELAETA